jgi:hypothetical protein
MCFLGSNYRFKAFLAIALASWASAKPEPEHVNVMRQDSSGFAPA